MRKCVTAIVVARGGSVRLPRKALLPFAGRSLIAHKVATLKRCKMVDRVLVNSDSGRILDEARSEGADTIQRPDYHGKTAEMLTDSAKHADEGVILWAHPTNPLVRAETYDNAIGQYFAAITANYDSLLSVTAVKRHAWYNGRPFNYDPWKPPHKLASELTPIMFQDGAIFIQTRDQMLANRYFFGDRPTLFQLDPAESIDIDTELDYRMACAVQGAKPWDC